MKTKQILLLLGFFLFIACEKAPTAPTPIEPQESEDFTFYISTSNGVIDGSTRDKLHPPKAEIRVTSGDETTSYTMTYKINNGEDIIQKNIWKNAAREIPLPSFEDRTKFVINGKITRDSDQHTQYFLDTVWVHDRPIESLSCELDRQSPTSSGKDRPSFNDSTLTLLRWDYPQIVLTTTPYTTRLNVSVQSSDTTVLKVLHFDQESKNGITKLQLKAELDGEATLTIRLTNGPQKKTIKQSFRVRADYGKIDKRTAIESISVLSLDSALFPSAQWWHQQMNLQVQMAADGFQKDNEYDLSVMFDGKPVYQSKRQTPSAEGTFSIGLKPFQIFEKDSTDRTIAMKVCVARSDADASDSKSASFVLTHPKVIFETDKPEWMHTWDFSANTEITGTLCYYGPKGETLDVTWCGVDGNDDDFNLGLLFDLPEVLVSGEEQEWEITDIDTDRYHMYIQDMEALRLYYYPGECEESLTFPLTIRFAEPTI